MNRKRMGMVMMVVSCCLAGVTAPVGAVTIYTDRAAFDAAVAAEQVTVEDFTDRYHFPISTGVLDHSTNLAVSFGDPILPGDIEPGVTFSAPIGVDKFFMINQGDSYEGGFLHGVEDRAFTVAFDGQVKGFGFETNSVMGVAFDLVIRFSSGPDFTATMTVADTREMQFFGFVSDRADIVSADLQGITGTDTFSTAMDNFTFTAPVPIPEPTSAALLVAAGVVIAARRWRVG